MRSWLTNKIRWTLQRRLFAAMLLLGGILLAALTAGLYLQGCLDSAGDKVFETLQLQMGFFEQSVGVHFDELTVASVQLSEDTAALLDEQLAQQGLSLHDAVHDTDAAAAMQEALMEPLLRCLTRHDCSGVFVLLGSSVNEQAKSDDLRAGIYLRCDGGSQEDVFLYRGISDIARKQEILLHPKWRTQFRGNDLPDAVRHTMGKALLQKPTVSVSEPFTLPGTTQRVMLVMTPIKGADGTLYGVCGYELSAAYFSANYVQPSMLSYLSFLLSAGDGKQLDEETGFAAGVSPVFDRNPTGLLASRMRSGGLTVFAGETPYVGVTKQAALLLGGETYTLAVLMPRADFNEIRSKNTLQLLLLIVLVLLLMVGCCAFFSSHLAKPILRAFARIEAGDYAQGDEERLPEIAALRARLHEQDALHQKALTQQEEEHARVLAEREAQYERMLAERDAQLRAFEAESEQARQAFAQTQEEYRIAQQALSAANTRLDRLAYDRKSEIDPDDYERFCTGLDELTKTERMVFDWYLEGRSTKEILALGGIKESTLKFHNHNMLGKLGVSSRKQMLRYAALLKQQDEAQA